MSNEENTKQVAIVVDNKVLTVMILNDILHGALTGQHTIVDLGENADGIDSTYAYNPKTRVFFK